MKYIRNGILITLILLTGGCVVANKVVTPKTKIEFKASSEVNPDITGRASPLVVRVYELTKTKQFNALDFFEAYEDPEKSLNDDLLATHEFEFKPGENTIEGLTLNKKTRYLAIIGAYRDIENAKWRQTLPAKPKSYKKMKVILQPLSIEIRRK